MQESLLTLTPELAGAPVSAEEFASAARQPPYIYERVQGRLVVMSPAGDEHRRTSRPFRFALSRAWSLHPELIDDVDIEGWVTTSPDDDRLPDICVYLRGPKSGQRVPDRVPDVVFEFVSAERSDQERDYIDKRAEYHAIGVREYVIVDRFKRAVLVLIWKDQDYAETWLHPPQRCTSPLLPDVAVELTQVFEDF
jgi:Uma2 family endonuclease